jgi:hypothetical protein
MSTSGSIFRVVADINSGYSFRCVVEYLYTHKKQGNFFFYPNRIVYNSISDNDKVLNDLVYESSELQNYTYNEGPDTFIAAGVDYI